MPDTRLVGATGIVRRLIELTHVLDAENAAGAESFPGELTTTVTSELFSDSAWPAAEITANGNGNGSNGARKGSAKGRAAVSGDADAP